MEEDRKKQIATFRFGVIHDLVDMWRWNPESRRD